MTTATPKGCNGMPPFWTSWYINWWQSWEVAMENTGISLRYDWFITFFAPANQRHKNDSYCEIVWLLVVSELSHWSLHRVKFPECIEYGKVCKREQWCDVGLNGAGRLFSLSVGRVAKYKSLFYFAYNLHTYYSAAFLLNFISLIQPPHWMVLLPCTKQGLSLGKQNWNIRSVSENAMLSHEAGRHFILDFTIK